MGSIYSCSIQWTYDSIMITKEKEIGALFLPMVSELITVENLIFMKGINNSRRVIYF